MYRHGRLSMRRKNEKRNRASTLASQRSNECADQLPTTLVVSIDKSIWIGARVLLGSFKSDTKDGFHPHTRYIVVTIDIIVL